jgi:outer membrane protein assembly factor BamB
MNTNPETHASAAVSRKPLRLMPGIVLAVLLVVVRFVLPFVVPDGELKDSLAGIGIIGGVVGALLIGLWWLFLSRASWAERLGAIALMAAAMFATRFVLHPSILGGMMGLMFYVYAIPGLAIALVVWAVASRESSEGVRRASLVVAILVACGAWTLVRSEGVMGGGADLRPRWSMNAEERLLAQGGDASQPLPPVSAPVEPPAPTAATASEPATATASPSKPDVPVATAPAGGVESRPVADPTAAPIEWTGFRGAGRDGVVRGIRIETDWVKSPPQQLWRRPIGPGWSSFAVRGDILYTQEQRGEDELVAAYRVSTGAPVWRHKDPVRFYESNAGAGPRATPSLSDERLYSLGATGIVNALDARTGAVVWTRDAAKDTGAKLPEWGFTGSPLVVDDTVVVAASGRLVAYDKSSGQPRWTAQTKGGSYSSPHLATIGGVRQVVMLSGFGATSVGLADGAVLWENAFEGAPIVQPALLDDGNLLISSSDAMGGLGIRRLAVAKGASGWTVEERWTSRGLKPYFNDYVVHDGHAYGFDGRILSCISLEDGAKKWKGGRYGEGQLVLLADQDLLLVLSEDGEIVLVSATPDGHKELAKIPALNGKTWNHPVVAGDTLLVRNGEEMVAFRLQRARVAQ